MEYTKKIQYFDYFVSRLIYVLFSNESENPNMNDVVKTNIHTCDFDRLKIMKLLFFASALNIDNKYLVDEIFDNFHAMPYGPVESDVYDEIDRIPSYKISKSVQLKDLNIINHTLDSEYVKLINDSIDKLYNDHRNLILMSSFDLVELSHKSAAWRLTFNEARRLGAYSKSIPSKVIKSTTVYFK